ncbi:MAG: class C sortase [Ruminococcus sp.]|uniref:class C sortase n=1 Tax=Ruminococcus sp. TaxID=41978 RepID=UPI0025FE144D|nr:class C sortase [Ruminococcus sp.]MBD9048675.1 class C sortase [Ruminococcus sp.]
MKTKIFFISLCVLAAVGIGFIVYPNIADYINSKNNETVISNYNTNTQTMSDEEINNELAKAQNFNELLAKSAINDEEKNEYNAAMSEYENILNYDDIMCTIEIPKINVDLPVYHDSTNREEKLKKGCVHLANTSLPIGGTSTHAVISAHSGYPEQVFFDELDKLEIGDTFKINVLNKTLTYKVCEINIVDPDDSSKLEIENGKDYVTLVTCYPYSINTHRLCVRGERVEDTITDTATADEVISNDNHNDLTLVFIILGISLLVVLIICIKRTVCKRR